jgi:hypothetical protein
MALFPLTLEVKPGNPEWTLGDGCVGALNYMPFETSVADISFPRICADKGQLMASTSWHERILGLGRFVRELGVDADAE